MIEENTNLGEEPSLDDGEISSTEEAFMKGYEDEADVEECAECGSAVPELKGLSKDIGGEEFMFCSNECAVEFEEGVVE